MVKRLAIAMAIVLLATTGMTMFSGGASPRAQTPVDLSTFTNGEAAASLLFTAPGNNTDLAVKLPKRVTVLGASMNVSALTYIWNDTFTDTVSADFAQFDPIYHLDVTSDNDNVTVAKAFDDNFNDKSLDPMWKWLNQPASYDEGNVSTGALRVTSSIGTDLWNTTVGGNYLYQNISGYTYSTVLKMSATPTVPGQRAGFMAYVNNTAWVAFLYGNDSTGMKLSRINTFKSVSSQLNISVEANPLYLRMDRGWNSSGTTFRFQYSTNGTDYISLDPMNVVWGGVFPSYTWLGPVVTDGGSGQSFNADFDDFSTNLYYNGGYMTSPRRLEPGEIQSCLLQWDVSLPQYTNISVGAMGSQYSPAWEPLQNNTLRDFSIKGGAFQYNVSLTYSFSVPTTPVLNEVRGNITVKDQPKNVSIDFGDHGAWDWGQPGTLGASTVNVDFAAALTREVQSAVADGEGLATIPITVHTDGKGTINLTGLSVRYVVNSEPSMPAVQGPANASWATTIQPSLTFSSTDEDAGTLQYLIEVYYRGVATPFLRIDQSKSSNGWSAKYYEAGAMANYTFPYGQELGQGEKYLWRARAYDGFAFGQWSEKREFYIDNSPPEGWVIDDGSETTSGTGLHCNLAITDVESGIVSYEVWLGTTPGGSDIMPVTAVTDPNVTVENLTLIYGYKYYFTARALNGAGMWSPPVSSDGIGVKKGAVNRPPAVNITSPAEGASLTAVVKLEGHSSDIDSLDTITVLVQVDEGEWMEAEGNLSWSFSWDSNKVQNGAHRITAKAWDGRASSELFTVNVSVSNVHDIQIISAEPSADPKLTEDSSMLFNVEARDPLNRQLGFQWFVDGEHQSGENKRVFTYKAGFSSAGTHVIMVSVYATPDQTNFTWNLSVTNLNRPPSANIASPAAGEKLTAGKPVLFDAAGSSDPDTEDNLTYSWNFGDGNMGSGLRAEHAYKKGGKYSVTLTVNDGYTYATVPVEVDVKATTTGTTDLWSQYGTMISALLAVLVVIVAVAAVYMAATRRKPARSPAARPESAEAPSGPKLETTISEEEERAFREGRPAGRPAEPAYEVSAELAAPAYREPAAASMYEAPAAPAYETAPADAYGQAAYEPPVDSGRPSWATPEKRAPAHEPAQPAYQEPSPYYTEPAAAETTLTPPPEAADEMARMLASLEGQAAPAPQYRAPPPAARAAPPRAPPARAPYPAAAAPPHRAPPPRAPAPQAYAPAARAPAPAYAPPAPADSLYEPAQAEPSMDDIFAKLQSIGEEFDTSAPAPPAPAPTVAPAHRPAAAPAYTAAAPALSAAAPAPAPAPARPAYAPTTMPVRPAGKKKLMRCPKCQVIFEVVDTGQRPLPIKCTACGATGAIKK